jgi:DNA topoisomerase-3
MVGGIPPLVQSVISVMPFTVAVGGINASQIANNAKVTDHHAIIPTVSMPKTDLSSLPTTERNILLMICARLISAVSEKHQYSETIITLDCNGEVFTVKGKTVTQNGWKTVEQAFLDSIGKTKKDEDNPLPELSEGQEFTVNASVREGFTKPPKHFTEDLLLSAMETAGAEDMPEDAERKGLGTPATRASIIENLVKSGLLSRKDKQLLPTDKGVNLIKVLPDSVKSPTMTAEWEHDLKRIEHGELTADAFMTAINQFVAVTVETHNSVPEELKALFPSTRPSKNGAGEVIGKCPRCGGNVAESPKGFFCDNKACKFAFFKESKYFTNKRITLTKDIATALLAEGRIFLKGLYSEKSGKTYNATIVLDDKGEGYPAFAMEFESKGGKNNG